MCRFWFKIFITIIVIFSICVSFTISSFAVDDSEIILYDGTTTTQLTKNGYDDGLPQINDSGQIVWDADNGNPFSDHEIFFYDGTTIKQLTDNDYDDWYQQINNSGQVVWSGYWFDDTDSGNSDFGGDGSGGDGGLCLISAAAYGFRMSKEILILALLFASMLIVFLKIRENFKN